uniref:Uncharacterized protein n=1 Tax=Castor canadensis TaxID=51338 RepID=A0A8C0W3C3_CASCN
MMHVTTFKWPEPTAKSVLLCIYLLHNLNCLKVIERWFCCANFYKKVWLSFNF